MLKRVGQHCQGWLPAYAGTRLLALTETDMTGPEHVKQGRAKIMAYAQKAGRATVVHKILRRLALAWPIPLPARCGVRRMQARNFAGARYLPNGWYNSRRAGDRARPVRGAPAIDTEAVTAATCPAAGKVSTT